MLGLGVMIQALGGNAETVNAYQKGLNKTINTIDLTDDVLTLNFTDRSKLLFRDNGQSCCEYRHMTSDDDLSYHNGAQFLKAELEDGGSKSNDYGEHEIQFLKITTSKGVFTIANHNEHNGYYGGFWIVAEYDESDVVNV